MAVKRIPVPFCDECGEPWLPKFKLSDGTHNPIFDKPERSKRCGKCKTTRWNAAGVDRRRKVVEEIVPRVTAEDVLQTLDMPEVPQEAFRYAEEQVARAKAVSGGTASTGRCCHMLYNCPQCHSKEAA